MRKRKKRPKRSVHLPLEGRKCQPGGGGGITLNKRKRKVRKVANKFTKEGRHWGEKNQGVAETKKTGYHVDLNYGRKLQISGAVKGDPDCHQEGRQNKKKKGASNGGSGRKWVTSHKKGKESTKKEQLDEKSISCQWCGARINENRRSAERSEAPFSRSHLRTTTKKER